LAKPLPEVCLYLVCLFASPTSYAGIYTNSFPIELHKSLPNASDDTISKLINSIFGVLPDWGTAERIALNDAYTVIMRQMTLVALVISAPTFVFVFLMPNNQLNDAQNLVESE
jgi:hypothetical protein